MKFDRKVTAQQMQRIQERGKAAGSKLAEFDTTAFGDEAFAEALRTFATYGMATHRHGAGWRNDDEMAAENFVKQAIRQDLTVLAVDLHNFNSTNGLIVSHRIMSLAVKLDRMPRSRAIDYVVTEIGKAVIEEFVNFTQAFEQ